MVAPDLQGHGLSDCFEGLRGYVRAFQDWVDDTELVRYGCNAMPWGVC